MSSIDIDTRWHSNSQYTYRQVTGTLTATLTGSTIKASMTLSQTTSYTAYGRPWGNDVVKLYIGSDCVYQGTLKTYTNVSGSSTQSSGEQSKSFTEGGNVVVKVTMTCQDSSGNCVLGGPSNEVTVGSINVLVPDPYTLPSYAIVEMTDSIGRADGSDGYSIKYYIRDGSNNLTEKKLHIYEGNTEKESQSMNKDKQSENQTATFDFNLTPSKSYKDGESYGCDITFKDGGPGDPKTLTDRQTIYTYTKPKITSVSTDKNEYKATDKIKFTCSGANNKTWNKLEDDFIYRYRVTGPDGNSTDSETTTWWDICGAEGRDFPQYETSLTNGALSFTEKRVKPSYDNQTLTLHVKRYSPSANWESDEVTTTFKVYYRPKKGITATDTKYRKNDQSGIDINKGQIVTRDSSLTGIYISWNFDTTVPTAGATQGYRIRLYDYKNNPIEEFYSDTKYFTIPINKIPKLNLTYIDITPYYKHNETDKTKYWYYNGTIEKIPLIRSVCELNKPEITYPVQSSDWINKDFRICFQLPEDDDYSVVTETYEYDNIEIKVNSQIFKLKNSNGTSTGSVLQDTIYSCLSAALTYQRKVIVWPNKVGITTAGSYQLSVRVKKKYGTTSTEHRWSPWSDMIVIHINEPIYNVNQYNKILATHFNDLLNTVDRIRLTYDVNWTDKQLNAIKNSTIIMADQYSQSKLLKKLVETKEKVNTYGTFDTGRTDIKFDSTNQLPATFNQTVGEYITADKDGTFTSQGQTRNGRNYIKYAYDRCKLLK